MRGASVVVGAVIALVLFAADAVAQPVGEVESPQGYPISLAERPLLLPLGVYEASAELQTSSSGEDYYGGEFGDYIYTNLGVRGGLGPVEVFAKSALLIEAPEETGSETFDQIGAGVLVPLGPGGALLVEGGVVGPSSDYKVINGHAAYLFRKQTAPGVAVQGGAGLGAGYYTPPGFDSYHMLNAEAQLGGQVQLQPTLGIEAGFRASVPIADSWEYDMPHFITTGLVGRLVYTATGFDAYGGLGLSSGYLSERVFQVGVVGRLQ